MTFRFWRNRDHELDEEIQSHFRMAVQERLERGMSPGEAEASVRMEFGNISIVKEVTRDMWGWRWLRDVGQDLRYAFRQMQRTPGFTVVAILTLALGIGTTTAIVSVVNGVLLRPAPFDRLDRLVVAWETDRVSGTVREPASVPDFLDFQSRTTNLDGLEAVLASEANLTPPTGDPLRLAALQITNGLLPLLGVEPDIGRMFTPTEGAVGGPDVALVSAALWQRVFSRDPRILGETILLNDRPHTIVGVVPDTTDFGVLQILSAAAYSRSFADRGQDVRVDAWVPLRLDAEALPRETHPIIMIGRLAASATVASAQEELAIIAADLEREFDSNRGRGVNIEELSDVVFGPVRPALSLLLVAVSLLLLVACVNVANLLIARGTARASEVAIRCALGAGRWRLFRQFVSESFVLAVAAAALGLALAALLLRLLVATAPAGVPRLSLVGLDGPTLAWTLTITAAVALVFGLIPATQIGHVGLRSALTDQRGVRGTAGPGASRTRQLLAVAELALALMLLVGAGLLLRSSWKLQAIDPGFRARGVAKVEYQLPPSRYPVQMKQFPNFPEQHRFTDAIVAGARELPGVVSVAVAGNHPLDPGFTNSFVIVGSEAESGTWPELSMRRVTPGYFTTVGLKVVDGRALEERDATGAPAVLLLNEAAAARLFPDRTPIGAELRWWGVTRTVVGVVANERIHGLGEAPPLAAYIPLAQAPSTNGAGVLLARTSGDPDSLAAALIQVIRRRDPELAVFGVEALEQTVARSVSQRRFTMLLLVGFAALALLLGAIGVYGVLSYEVARRRREIGIRMALGAHPSSILRLVLQEGLVLVAFGLAVGGAGALALARLLDALLFGVEPHDPATLVSVAGLLATIALAAIAVPAWRAGHVAPAEAIREP